MKMHIKHVYREGWAVHSKQEVIDSSSPRARNRSHRLQGLNDTANVRRHFRTISYPDPRFLLE